MARLTDGAELLKCSFCGKSQKQVRKLIGGSGAYICDECIELCNEIIEEELGAQQQSSSTTPLPKPREINEFLNTWVIGQDRAKRALSVAVYNHYKRVRSREAGNNEDMLGTKSNILLLGPTGTGKTHLARCLARLLDVPFAIVDATALTEAGYVGEDVENILLRLIQEADGDIKKAEKGIIYVDEIDKIGRKAENASITRDVSGEGVQQALLKIIEGTVASVPPTGGRKHPHQQFLEIDTSGILFIAAGAFAGIEDIVKARLGRRSTGFGSELKSASEMGDLYEAVSAEDLHKFGMIPEFIGRLPILTSTKELTEEDLVRVLTEPFELTRAPVPAPLRAGRHGPGVHPRGAPGDRRACQRAQDGCPRPVLDHGTDPVGPHVRPAQPRRRRPRGHHPRPGRGRRPRRALPGTLLGRQAQRLSPPARLRSVETLGEEQWHSVTRPWWPLRRTLA